MIFIDEYDQVSGINDEITQIGGSKKKDAYSGDRVEMDFGWGGKERKVIFYKQEITNETIDKLPVEMKNADIVFMKLSNYRGDAPTAKALEALKIGGFYISDDIGMFKVKPSSIGFKEISPGHKFAKSTFGNGHLHLYQKIRQEPKIEKVLEFDSVLARIENLRDGFIQNGDAGFEEFQRITDQLSETVRPIYKEKLEDLKKRFDELPHPVKSELRQRTINRLVTASGSIFLVVGAYGRYGLDKEYVENSIWNETNHLIPMPIELASRDAQHSNAPGADDIKRWEGRLREQLNRYIEDRRKDFREVLRIGVRP